MSAENSNCKPVQALLNAVSASKLRLVRLLIEGGVHVDTRNDRGQTPLLITCSTLKDTCHMRGETRERVVKYLITAGADVNACDVTGRTPLIYAVITRAQSSVLFDLIDAGAEPWWDDCSHKCAFDYALQQQDIALVEVIVDAYKRRKMRETGTPRDVGDTRGISLFLEQGEDTSSGDKLQRNKKSSFKRTKNKQESQKTAKVYSDNRKKPSRQVSTPNLKTFATTKTDDSISSPTPKRDSLPDVTPNNPTRDSKWNIVTPPNLSKSPPNISQGVQRSTCDPQETATSVSTYPTQSTNFPENIQLCDLCKTVFSCDHDKEDSVSDPPTTSTGQNRNLDFSEYDFSGLLYRRRSTGSLFGLTEKRYESIRKKHELGITLEDLFSSTEINQPGKHPLYVKSSRTNTMIDISTNELLVPGTDRVRSMSVCLPALDDVRRRLRVGDYVNMLRSRDQKMGFSQDSMITQANSFPHLSSLPRKSCIYLGSDEECDDIIIIPAASCKSMTSSPDDDSGSQHDVTSPQKECKSPLSGAGKDDSESETCSSPIPTIVFTDYVNSDQM